MRNYTFYCSYDCGVHNRMFYSPLNVKGLTASRLGFGAMRLPITEKGEGQDEAGRLIHHALLKGINIFDAGTFYCHGYCEKVLGEVLKVFDTSHFVFTGKNSSHQDMGEGWTEQLERSLRLLGCDCFDMYFIHYLTLEIWERHYIEKGVIEELKAAKSAKKTKCFAFSSHDSPQNVLELVNCGFFQGVMTPYNLLDRQYEDVLKLAHNKGLATFVMNPLLGGHLAKREIIGVKWNSSSPARLSLSFVLSQPFIDVVFSGMQTEEEIDENISFLDEPPLTEIEQKNLLEEINNIQRCISVPCTGCNYCNVCPQGIDIPRVLSIYNQYCLLKGEKLLIRDYSMLDINAESCIACGSCSIKCPQDIDIPFIMKEMCRRCVSSIP